MAQQTINNGETGLIVRGKINDNFTELYGTDYKVEWYEEISSGTAGTLTKPTGSTILLNEWANGVDALASTSSGAGDLPLFETPVTAGGVPITATLDASGNWTLSDTPSSYPVDILYVVNVPIEFYDPTKSLVTTEVGGKQNTSEKDATGGYAGLTLFKLNLKNAANTFTNFFTNTTTAARTWTLPDKDGTVAMTSDITGDVSAAAVIADNAIVAGDGGAKGVQGRSVIISDTGEVSGGKGLIVTKAIDYTLLATDSGKTFEQTGAGKTFSLPADTSSFDKGWFVNLYAPVAGVVSVNQLATADATIVSKGDFLDISAKSAATLDLADATVAAFVFRLTGGLE